MPAQRLRQVLQPRQLQRLRLRLMLSQQRLKEQRHLQTQQPLRPTLSQLLLKGLRRLRNRANDILEG